MDNNKVIGQRINEALAMRNKKQKDLAAHLGVKDNVISYFCSGARTPNIQQIIKISEYLNVSTDYLLGKNVPMSTQSSIIDMVALTGLSEKSILQLAAWKNIGTTLANSNGETPIDYIRDIIDDVSWVKDPNVFADSIIEFTNTMLSAYLDNPRIITMWYQGYMYSLHTWYAALKNHEEEEILLEMDSADRKLFDFGLVAVPAEDSASIRLSSIMELLKEHFSSIAKNTILKEIDE